MTQTGDSRPIATETGVRARIERAVARARAVLLWERVWPYLAPLAALAAIFATISWFGIWRFTSTSARIAILAAFAAAAGYLVFRARRLRSPARAEAFARVEQATGVLHRPATAFTDKLATRPDDAMGQALWMAHRTRLLAALDRLKAGVPAPELAKRDPFALRFAVILLFVVGFIVGGPERIERLTEAFRGGETVAATVARIDAWVTPPAYTSRPPIFLTGDKARPEGTEYSVPAGSVVTVRTGGARDLEVVYANEASELAATTAPTKAGTDSTDAILPVEHQVTLSKAGAVAVRKGERTIASWRFAVEPDSPPTISLLKPPQTELSGALNLAYALKDDFGVVSGRAEIVPADDSTAANGARPLFEAPKFPLSLPQLRIRDGSAQTIRDLTSHPWAGAKVRLTLVAQDEAGQEGRSAPIELTLPARRFNDPLAKAIVEQRAALAVDANAVDRVADALDALTIAPDKGIKDIGNYLAVVSAHKRLLNARTDDDLRGMVDYLWSIALGIEDGDLSLTAQALRDAQEALRQALENGASDEEIARLTQELREAMQKFLQALAEEAMRNPQLGQIPPGDMQTLRSQDLERMLDQIERLAQTGARDAARQLLSELQNMLENLQAGRPMQGQQGDNQMMQNLEQLGEMIRRQQQLMDRTYRAERGQSPDGEQRPLTKEELEQALRQLQQGQQDLEQALKDLMAQMDGMGMEPNGKLGQAGEAMGRAAGQLGQGQPGAAVGSQGEAIDALRQGAQGLAQQFANRGFGRGGIRGGENMPNEDPLGRPQRTTGPDLGNTVKVPDEIDTQRAREILDAIRKRLGEMNRPEFERDYLERLLDRF